MRGFLEGVHTYAAPLLPMLAWKEASIAAPLAKTRRCATRNNARSSAAQDHVLPPRRRSALLSSPPHSTLFPNWRGLAMTSPTPTRHPFAPESRRVWRKRADRSAKVCPKREKSVPKKKSVPQKQKVCPKQLCPKKQKMCPQKSVQKKAKSVPKKTVPPKAKSVQKNSAANQPRVRALGRSTQK